MRNLAFLSALMIFTAPTALAADVAQGADPCTEGSPDLNAGGHSRGTILVVSVIAGVFTDLGPTYQQAFTDLGYPTDLRYDPNGAWPDLSGYEFVLVDFSDLWWEGCWSAGDEAVLARYVDEGGRLILIGQDYLSIRGADPAFPEQYLGIRAATADVNAGASVLEWSGTPEGPLETEGGTISACFGDRGWYTDAIVPSALGLMMWQSPGMPYAVEGGSATSRAVFSSVEIACTAAQGRDSGEDLRNWLQKLLDHLSGVTPAEQTSWGRLKTLCR